MFYVHQHHEDSMAGARSRIDITNTFEEAQGLMLLSMKQFSRYEDKDRAMIGGLLIGNTQDEFKETEIPFGTLSYTKHGYRVELFDGENIYNCTIREVVVGTSTSF